MAYPEDPNFAPLHILAAGVVANPTSRGLHDTADSIAATITSIDGNASGATINSACEALVLAKASVTLCGDNAMIVESAIVALNAAAISWEGMRPGPNWKAHLDGLDSDVNNANAEMARAAQAWDDAETETEDAKAKSDYAVAAKAQKVAWEAQRIGLEDRKLADRIYEGVRAQAAGLLDQIVAPDGFVEGGTVLTRPGDDSGGDAPDQTLRGVAPTGGTPAPGTPASPGTATPPAATNPTGNPTETADPSKLTAADLATLASAAQTPAAAGTPAATTPAAGTPAVTTPQPAATDKKPVENTPAEPIDLDDLIRNGILPAPGLAAVTGLSGAPGRNPTVTPATPAVASPPAPIAATTGNSLSGMRTASDVSGSATPPANAFTAPAETKTSAATGNQTAATPTGTRPGMPMGGMPMSGVPMGAAGAPGGGKPTSGEDAKPAVTRYQPEAGGNAVSEAVRGGTIAQRRDKDQDQ